MMIEIYSDKKIYVDIHINPSPSELLKLKYNEFCMYYKVC